MTIDEFAGQDENSEKKQRRGNRSIAQISIQILASANRNSAKTLEVAFREPRATSLSAISTATDTVTQELNEKLDQMDDRFCQRLEALEKEEAR